MVMNSCQGGSNMEPLMSDFTRGMFQAQAALALACAAVSRSTSPAAAMV